MQAKLASVTEQKDTNGFMLERKVRGVLQCPIASLTLFKSELFV
jgi:hypothetical protein